MERISHFSSIKTLMLFQKKHYFHESVTKHNLSLKIVLFQDYSYFYTRLMKHNSCDVICAKNYRFKYPKIS